MGAPRPWTSEGSSFTLEGPGGFEFSAIRVEGSGGARRGQEGPGGPLEGSNFQQSLRGQEGPWSAEGFEFSVRADRVRVLVAMRPWAAKGSSFLRWATGGFEFWVHRDPGRQRVRVLRLRGQEGSNFQQSELKGQEGPGGARRGQEGPWRVRIFSNP